MSNWFEGVPSSLNAFSFISIFIYHEHIFFFNNLKFEQEWEYSFLWIERRLRNYNNDVVWGKTISNPFCQCALF